ncbi:hypothetical protein CBR_g4680 [Chara braunii]|uniref:Uncharacterized protein n=1 Tax=Chara braunii TaxID=69332 RepID=A0A388KII3_CHABU|nr:hypothetical protein CBR_g4680 [Chara braunii]|eukprot:GBG69852.1 hypothetical protein CBR_g4680 [Chara braunii]
MGGDLQGRTQQAGAELRARRERDLRVVWHVCSCESKCIRGDLQGRTQRDSEHAPNFVPGGSGIHGVFLKRGCSHHLKPLVVSQRLGVGMRWPSVESKQKSRGGKKHKESRSGRPQGSSRRFGELAYQGIFVQGENGKLLTLGRILRVSMDIITTCVGEVCGRAIVIHELRHRQGDGKGLDFRYSKRVATSSVCHYRVMANGALVLELCIGLGYCEDLSCEVTVFVTKASEDVPNVAPRGGVDVLEGMAKLVTSDLLQEHADRQVDFVEWEAILQAPLEERRGMRGVLRIADSYNW